MAAAAGDARPPRRCPDCGIAVAYASFARHRQTHHLPLVRAREAPLACPEPGCGKAFRRADHLARHRQSHEPVPPFACPECAFRTARADTLARHVRSHRLEQAELRLAASASAADALRAQLEQAQRAVDGLRQELDDARAELPADGAAEPAAPGRARGGRCSCGVTDQPALLGAVFRCVTPRCAARFHFVCAGYAVVLVNANSMAMCAACLQQANRTPETIERADREVALLDAHLAARRLKRVEVDSDGLCLFRALAASTAWTHDDLLKATMQAVIDHDWSDLLDPATERERKREAGAHLQRTLRMSNRWDSDLLDLVWRVLPDVLGGPIARYELRDGRHLGGEQPDGAVARICAYHRGIGQDHYDAVVPV